MRHMIYLTSSIEKITEDAIEIGAVSSFDEACRIIHKFLESSGFRKDKYWRYCLAQDATFIDFGSWSRFIAITPPFSNKEMFGEQI